ncbi:acyl-CoA synthetase short-chain family member 3, mitochondrial-like isoform X1 [Patiria miniata]|uniref:Acyl-CoA synthetase short-chain family member 3, mitochondrial n=1 Tax=Patiria miniata TaxID=46514 RepID=A0A914BLT0_PATMI|nr:acyl-CoA synthetase short-chain family member 3, mitochondrial-like isoform X1 [Patiria miniata]
MQFLRCLPHSRWTSFLSHHRRKLLPAVGTRPENWTGTTLPRSLGTAAGCSAGRQREHTADLSDSSRWTYDEVYRRSLHEPEEFWHEQAEKITWFKKWDKVLEDNGSPFTKWFIGGETNICYNAVDRHVDSGHGDQTAIIHDSPVTNTVQKITYKELQQEVAKLAQVFIKQGVKYGDRIIIYMPMIPQAVIAMLASARIGAIHGLVFGGFASKELAVRINHAKPKVIVSASCGVEPNRVVDYKELLNKAISMSDFTPECCIIYNRPDFHPVDLIADRDICWHEAMARARGHDCVPVQAADPVYLLYSSGTTGQPKAIVRPSGSHAVVLNWSMKTIYGINPGEAWWAASDLGWVVGHSYICWAPLLTRCQTIVYEGKPVGTPDPGAFFRVLQQHDVAGMFTAPTALRAIMKEDETGEYAKKYPLTKFRTLFVAGEHCDQETMHWGKAVFNTPVLDNWWQTETGWPITASPVGLGTDLHPPHGVTGKPVPGWNVKVLNENCEEAKPNELGRIAVKLPLPPGAINTLWENDERFENLYFQKYPGYYDTMDAGCRTEEGYISVQSRADDVINVAGHRIAASAIEEAIIDQGDVVECAVIPLQDALKGLIPVGLVVIKNGVDKPHQQIIKEVIDAVRSGVGPVAAFKKALIIGKLPKTRSGKIPRQSVADMANGKPFNIPPTIEDASAYGMIREEMVKNGILKQQKPA